MPPVLSQIAATLRSLPGEFWAALAPLVAFLIWVAKKPFTRPKPVKPDLVTRAEFHHALDSVRDKIDARSDALAEKIDHLAERVSDRLTNVEAAVARLDERTMAASPLIQNPKS